jgi:hypothetical protein
MVWQISNFTSLSQIFFLFIISFQTADTMTESEAEKNKHLAISISIFVTHPSGCYLLIINNLQKIYPEGYATIKFVCLLSLFLA